MPREYNISWNDNQRKRLNSAVRRYNNAIRKAVKNNPIAKEFLPSEVKYQDLKKSITTRRALNNTVNRLLRATRKGALEFVRQDDGSLVTRYERKEFAILRSVRERKKSMAAKKSKANDNPIKKAQYTPDKRPAKSFSAKSLRRFLETQEREMNRSSYEKLLRYFRNYRSAVETVFGGFSEYDEKIEAIDEKIKSLIRSRDYQRLLDAFDESPIIDFVYDPLARDAKMEKLWEYWNKV